jgi:hypothetical protein
MQAETSGEWKLGQSFLWNEEGKYLNLSWKELKNKITKVTGGFGIAADDFAYLLQYDMGYRRHHSRREAYVEISADIKEPEDVEILCKIIIIIVLQGRLMDAAWAIVLLTLGDEEGHFDYRRQGAVLNWLYELNPLYTKNLVDFIAENWADDEPIYCTLIDRIRDSGHLREEIIKMRASVSVFISYAREDKVNAERLRQDLVKAGLAAWKDDHEILPGENFDQKIRVGLRKADCAILCLSSESVSKVGYVQVEMEEALQLQKYRPDTKIFIIPVRFDSCEVPFRILDLKLHYEDLFPDWAVAVERVIATIKHYFPT